MVLEIAHVVCEPEEIEGLDIIHEMEKEGFSYKTQMFKRKADETTEVIFIFEKRTYYEK